MTAALGLLAGLLLLSYGTAVVPLGPPEAYVFALAASGSGSPLWGLAVAGTAALGQVAGKLTVFLGARASLRCSSRWPARLSPDRLVARVARVAGVARFGAARPRQLAVLVAVSALVGVPPLTLVAPAVGTTAMRPLHFVAVGLVGRLARFALLALVLGPLW